MQKEVGQPYQNIVNQSMTGTSQIFSAISNILYKDSVGLELIWSGAAVGSFQVMGSIDYKPPLAQTQGFGAPTNGNFVALAIQNPLTGTYSTTISTTLGSPILINLNQLAFAWLQVIYTNISSTGTLNGFITSKSLG